MIILSDNDIIIKIDSSQNISFENLDNSAYKEILKKQIELIITVAQDEYNVANGYFENFLAEKLRDNFDIIELVDEQFEKDASKNESLIY